MTQTEFLFSLCCPFFDSARLHIGALAPVMPTSLDCVQGERDCLMLLPQFHLSVALTKAFDCQNPDSLDSNPLLFKCRFLLLICFETLSKDDSALYSKAAFLSSCTNTAQFELSLVSTQLTFRWDGFMSSQTQLPPPYKKEPTFI